jgi:hypothetical protein
VTDRDPHLAIGVDPAQSATGLVLIDWNISAKAIEHIIWTCTITPCVPSTWFKALDQLAKACGIDYPDACGIEAAAGPNPSRTIDCAFTGGGIFYSVFDRFRGIDLRLMQASVWRSAIGCPNSKKDALAWVEERYGRQATEHETEAMGIVSAACLLHDWHISRSIPVIPLVESRALLEDSK